MIRRAGLCAAFCGALALIGGAALVQAQGQTQGQAQGLGGVEDWAQRVASAARAAETAQGRDARLRALTALIVAQESAQAALRRDLRVLGAIETAARDRLAARAGALSGLLIALQKQGQGAAPLPLLHPQGALGGGAGRRAQRGDDRRAGGRAAGAVARS